MPAIGSNPGEPSPKKIRRAVRPGGSPGNRRGRLSVLSHRVLESDPDACAELQSICKDLGPDVTAVHKQAEAWRQPPFETCADMTLPFSGRIENPAAAAEDVRGHAGIHD